MTRSELLALRPCQINALAHIRSDTVVLGAAAREQIQSLLNNAALDARLFEAATRNIQTHAQVALHFHPERLSRAGVSVAQGLLESGVYKNQFETGLSSGSPSAFSGGERDLWENRLFGGAYHAADVLPSDRPKYGALEIMDYPDGPSPRFGSCYFVLHTDVSKRSTFTFGGSQEDDSSERTGTADVLEPVMAPLLAQLEQGSGAFGIADLTSRQLLEHLTNGLPRKASNLGNQPLGRALDSFVEVQVHGDIHLRDDVASLVVDPSFRNHPVGVLLVQISTAFDIPLSWHPGFTLPVSQVPDVFRGYPVRPLAERIAGAGMLDAATIGAAANTVELEPQQWKDWANYEDILTQFRRLWHVLVLNGTPAASAPTSPAPTPNPASAPAPHDQT